MGQKMTKDCVCISDEIIYSYIFLKKICIRLMQSQNQVTHSHSFYSVLLYCTQLTGR